MTATDLVGLATSIAERVVAPTTYQYAHQEEDRIAFALAQILSRQELTSSQAIAWLNVVDQLLAGPGPSSAEMVNTLAVLRATYAMCDRFPMPHRASVTDAIAARLHAAFPPYPSPGLRTRSSPRDHRR